MNTNQLYDPKSLRFTTPARWRCSDIDPLEHSIVTRLRSCYILFGCVFVPTLLQVTKPGLVTSAPTLTLWDSPHCHKSVPSKDLLSAIQTDLIVKSFTAPSLHFVGGGALPDVFPTTGHLSFTICLLYILAISDNSLVQFKTKLVNFSV